MKVNNRCKSRHAGKEKCTETAGSKGRGSRPERSRTGVEILGRGEQQAPARRSGVRCNCKLPSGVWGGDPAEIEFGAIWP